jgi:hypothetical protein
MIGLELEALAVKPRPLERREWLKVLERVEGEEVLDPCTNQLVGKKTKEFLIKTDTTSAIIEVSVEPGREVVERAFQALEELGLDFYERAYYPNPGRRWYLRNATPRGHYSLLQRYGYEHWRIATMASSQVWLDVRKEELPRALDALNKASPWLIERFWNSPYAGWKEYRVKAWIDFSANSWVAPPFPWAPKTYSSWEDVLADYSSGRPQEVPDCLDLSHYSWEELAEDFERGRLLGRRADMGFGEAKREDLLKGMQRWTFRPAIPRWKASEARPEAVKGLLGDDPRAFLDSLEKVMVEVRLLPYLPKERLLEAVETLQALLEAEPPEVSDFELREAYLRAAKGLPLPEWAKWPEKALRV